MTDIYDQVDYAYRNWKPMYPPLRTQQERLIEASKLISGLSAVLHLWRASEWVGNPDAMIHAQEFRDEYI